MGFILNNLDQMSAEELQAIHQQIQILWADINLS
jgi:hypothetical protein